MPLLTARFKSHCFFVAAGSLVVDLLFQDVFALCCCVAVFVCILVNVHVGKTGYTYGENLTHYAEEADADMTSLTVARLSQEHLTDGVFSRFTKLKTLEFDGFATNVEAITSGPFEGLVSLLRLDMFGCKIRRVEDFAFTPLRNLKKLDISYNRIETVTNSTFKGLGSLIELDLTENPLVEIDTGAFADLHNLRRLCLNGNFLTGIQQEWFQNLQSLRELEFASVYLDTIPENIFSDLVKLKKVRIDRGTVGMLRSNMWTGLSSLKNLILKHDGITTIQAGTFRDMGKLETLDLWGNKLHLVHPAMWKGLNSLSELGLGLNQLRTVPPRGFANLPHLQKLNLNHNKLTTLTLDVLDPQYFENGHPKNLSLSIMYLPLDCDDCLCWLKEGEEEGWIYWYGTFVPENAIPQCLRATNADSSTPKLVC